MARPFKTVEPVPLEGKSSPVSFRKLAELRTLDTHLNPVSALHLKGDEIGRIRVMVHVAVLVVCLACSMVTFGYNVSIHRQQGLFIGIGPFPVHAEPGYGNNDGNYGNMIENMFSMTSKFILALFSFLDLLPVWYILRRFAPKLAIRLTS
ncbi:hypothetical protein ERICI_02056 [Paenibacillus larvae subsp. larvae]|nr:hypothetical protein ERICI_02056 [Paenibacillus larvae subsp. larvae]ETK27307.1 hypothetical protein ERIC1_1c07510 [Paenibacillus larvae subsp. larvae DSM 25719]